MDCLAQIILGKYSNPIEFLNQLRQTTEPIGGGMEHCDNGEYVEYDVAIEAVKKAQKQLIEKVCEWIKDNATYYAHWEWNGDTYEQEVVFDAEECIKALKQTMRGE